jgi:5-methylcytosine-specific restriction endonuclease McrA
MAEWHHSNEWRKARAYAKTVLEPRCAICSKELIDKDWTIDHINASNPPNHDITNLQSMCNACNGTKQDRVLERTAWRNAKYYQ